MARRIAEEGFPLTLWARRPEALVPFQATTASIAPTPREVGASSDVVGICVVADADVEQVCLGPDGVLSGMAPGGVIVIHSTVHPETCLRLSDQARRARVGLIDAPVSGGGQAAASRRLLVMVGGDGGDVARCRPVFDSFAEQVIHLGPVGSGQTAKVLNNLVFTAQVTVALETFGLADQLGIDRAAMAQVLAGGSGGSKVATILSATGFDLAGLRGAAPLLRKDVAIVADVLARRHSPGAPALQRLAEASLKSLEQGGE